MSLASLFTYAQSLFVITFLLVDHFIDQSSFTSMGKLSPTDPTSLPSLGTCLVSCCRRQRLQLCLHGIHYHSHLFQLCHECLVGTGKICIGLCQSFQFVNLWMHYLENGVQVIDILIVLFWWGWRSAVDIFNRCCISPLSWSGDRSPLLLMRLEEKGLEPSPCLEIGGFPSPPSNAFVDYWYPTLVPLGKP